MIADTLRRLIDQKHTSAREIGELTGAAPSTVYRWISGQSEPTYTSLRLLVRLLPHKQAQQELLTCLTAGSQWVTYNFDVDTDINNDGRIDTHDALDASVTMVMHAAESLKAVREACRDHRISQQECADVVAKLDQVIRACSIAQQVLVEISDAQQHRKLKLTR